MLSLDVIEQLYRTHAGGLLGLVRRDAGASEEVVQDACQHAWSSVLVHRERVDEQAVFSWLTTAAVREAWRLARPQEVCAWSSDGGEDDPAGWSSAVAGAGAQTPSELVELRERLRALKRLPVRQQRLLWLCAAGHSYAEMARYEGVSRRTVERQLLRGKRSAREWAEREWAECGEERRQGRGHSARA